MSIFGFRKTQMVSAEDALPGRDTPMPVPERHAVLGTPLTPPYPEGSEIAEFALGCFWGEERTFWQVPGVITTAVGYEGGFTPNPAARSLTCSADSSPLTYSVLCPPRKRFASAMLVSVDFPIPGDPPSSTSDPGTRPPPSTRSSSPIPVDIRCSGPAPTSLKGRGTAAAARRAPPGREPPPAGRPRPAGAPAPLATGSSTSEFHAPHSGQRPCHCADWWPHCEQPWTVSRAIGLGYGAPGTRRS